MDFITIEMLRANVGACITSCTIHPKNANYPLHCNSVTPRQMLQHAPTFSPHEIFNLRKTTVQLTSRDL